MLIRGTFAVQNTESAGSLQVITTVDCDIALPASDFLCSHSWTQVSKF